VKPFYFSLRMRSILHFFGNVSSLECKRPVIYDTNLEGVKLDNLQSNLLEYANEKNGCMKILTSGLIEAATFPPSLLSPKLLQMCIDHNDVRSRSILNNDGEIILSISRENISSILHLLEITFVAFSPIQSLAKYRETPRKFLNTLSTKWTETKYGGHSRLAKVITKDHLKPHIHDLVVLLHRVKGSTNVFLFEEWMYRYIEIILKGEQWMDWVEIIASSLRDQLNYAKESRENFSMAPYLTYCIACVFDLTPLPHGVKNEEIIVFQYFPLLEKDKALENFRKVHDVLMENMYVSLMKAPMPRLSPKAQRLIQKYKSYFIQLLKFSYMRIGRFEEQPTNLLQYALDCFVLVEICK